MDPQDRFCHTPNCPARGQLGLDNIRIHSKKERRYRCLTCNRTFAETRDTPLYRLKKPTELVTIVLTLLCHGCPLQAIVAAFNGEDGGTKARIGSTIYAGRYYAGVAATDLNVNIYSIALGTDPMAVTQSSLAFGIDQYPTLDASNVSVLQVTSS